MGRLRGWVRRLERKGEGEMVVIPRPSRGVARFLKVDLADANIVALDRTLGRSDRDYPLCQAARRSPDPKWSESVFAGPETVPERIEDLSED